MATLKISDDLKKIINETQRIPRFAHSDRNVDVTYTTYNRTFPFDGIFTNTNDFIFQGTSIKYIGSKTILCKVHFNVRLDWNLQMGQNYHVSLGINSGIYWPSNQTIVKNGVSQMASYGPQLLWVNPNDYFDIIISCTGNESTGGSNGHLLIEEIL